MPEETGPWQDYTPTPSAPAAPAATPNAGPWEDYAAAPATHTAPWVDYAASAPGVPGPKLPEELKSDAQQVAESPILRNRRTGLPMRDLPTGQGNPITNLLDAPVTGGRQIVAGTEQMAQPELRQKAGGLHKVISGAFEAATPLMAGSAVVAPIATAVTLGTTMATQSGVDAGLKALGLPEEYAAVAGDLTGLVAGAATHKLGSGAKEWVTSKLRDRWEAKQGGAAADEPTEQQFTSTGEPIRQSSTSADPVPPAAPVPLSATIPSPEQANITATQNAQAIVANAPSAAPPAPAPAPPQPVQGPTSTVASPSSAPTLVPRPPAPVSLSTPLETPVNSPSPSTTGLAEIGNAGTAITGNMYDALWAKVQAGDTIEGGKPSAVLQVAKRAKAVGGMQSTDDLRAMAQDYAGITSKGADRQKALRDLVTKYSPIQETPNATTVEQPGQKPDETQQVSQEPHAQVGPVSIAQPGAADQPAATVTAASSPKPAEPPADEVKPKPVPATNSPVSASLPRDLQGAKPRYNYGAKAFTLDFESDLDKAAYITAQKAPSKGDESYLNFVAQHTGLSDSAIRSRGVAIKARIKVLAKDAEPGALSVPGQDKLWPVSAKPPAGGPTPSVGNSPEAPTESVDKGATVAETPRTEPLKSEAKTPQSEQPTIKPREPGWVGNIPTSEILVDAPRFQFKRNVGQGGAGEELREVTKYDPEKAGITSVWRDPADGKTYVVNGHHRVELAQRLGAPEMTVRYLDAKDAQEARAKGALINISEGRGESTDAAKVMRDRNMSAEDLKKEGVSLKGKIASEGLALSKLAQPIYDDVMSGDLSPARGAVLGGIENPQDQLAVYDLMKQREKTGKRMTNDQVAELTRLATSAPQRTETQDSLFGTEEMTRSLLPERAEVSDYVRKQLGAERKLFGVVGTQGAAERLGEAGNVIKADENKYRSETANQGLALYDKFSTVSGPIGTALDRASQRIADGENADVVKRETYRQIRASLTEHVKQLSPGGSEVDVRRAEGLGKEGPLQAGGGQRNSLDAGGTSGDDSRGTGARDAGSTHEVAPRNMDEAIQRLDELEKERRAAGIPPVSYAGKSNRAREAKGERFLAAEAALREAPPKPSTITKGVPDGDAHEIQELRNSIAEGMTILRARVAGGNSKLGTKLSAAEFSSIESSILRTKAKLDAHLAAQSEEPQFARDLTVPRDWSQTVTVSHEQLYSEADWEDLPAQGDRRPARIRLNRQAAIAIGDAAGGRHFTGLHIPQARRSFVEHKLFDHAEDLYDNGQITFATFEKIAALSREIGQYGRGGDLVIYRADGTRTIPQRASDLIEEFTHWQQQAGGEPSQQVTDAMAAHPAFRLVQHALRAGYGDDRAKLVNEMGAKLAAAKFSELGVNRKIGLSLLKKYYSELERAHGPETADRILRYTDKRAARDAGIPRNRQLYGSTPPGGANAEPEAFSRIPERGRAGVGTGVRADAPDQPGLFDSSTEQQSKVDAQRGKDKLLGDQLTAQFKSGLAARPTKLKPAQTRGLFDEQEPETGSLFGNAAREDEEESAWKRFMGDESGSSRVGTIFKADLDEMRALKAKRDAATEQLKQTQADPLHTDRAQKLSEYYMAERDLWSTRVNQVMERLRKTVPNPVDQEALSIMRDFTHRLPFELPAWLNGTHPVLEDLEPKDREAVAKNIERLRPAIERAMNPTPKMIEANDVLSQIAEASAKEAVQRGMIERGLDPQRYFTHLLNPKGEGEIPQTLGERIGKAMGGKLGLKYAFAAHRGYPTVLDAIADNVKPKTLNALDAFTIHGDKFATARATHLLLDHLNDTNMGVWDTMKGGDSVPDGWVKLAPHSNEFHDEFEIAGTDDGTGKPEKANRVLWVHPAVAKAMRPITDPDYMHVVRGFSDLRARQALMKQAQLSLSLFHARALNIMALGNMGARGWIKGLRADRSSPEFEAAERRFVIRGGTSPIQGKNVEAYKSLEPGSIPSWQEIWRHAPVAREVDKLAQANSRFIFDNLQRKFKVTDFQIHSAAWEMDHPNATPEETAEAETSIAKEINAVYGGLNWERLGVNHASLEVARALLLAPDWTFSNVFNVKYATEGGLKAAAQQVPGLGRMAPKSWEGQPAGKLARAFWIKTIVGGLAATQLMSYLLTGKPSKNLTQVYMGKDKKGQEIHQNMFFAGAPQDATSVIDNVNDYGAVEGLFRTMANKTAPGVHVAMDLMKNEDFMGRPIVEKGMHPVASTTLAAEYLAKGLLPIPYSVQNAKDMLIGPKAKLYKWWELPSTLVAGSPPRHSPPAGKHMTKHGLTSTHPKPLRSTWQEIVTGKR